MIVKKQINKSSIEHTLIQGDRIFKFIEYTDDVWSNNRIYLNQTKPMYSKGDCSFSTKGKDYGFGSTWFPATNKKITNIKEAKKFVNNREYM
jgi:hypothetical protein